MSIELAALTGYAVVVASTIGILAVAVAAVVVVLAIIAVIVMVLRSSGGARQVSGGIGYGARERTMGQPRDDRDDYDSSASPWARQANRQSPTGARQDVGANYGGQPPLSAGQARTSGANWGAAAPTPQPAGGAWGAPAAANYGSGASAPAQGNGAWNDSGRDWNGANAGPAGPAGTGIPNGQGQAPWEAPANPAGARPWENQSWGPAQQAGTAQPSNGNWAPGAPPMMAAGPWNGASGAPEPPAPDWGMPPAAAPAQNAWGVAAGGPAPEQNAWGIPSARSMPNAEAWGGPAAPTSPNWGNPPAATPNGWAQPAPSGAPVGYGVASPNAPYGTEVDPRQRSSNGSPAGAVVIRQGKEPGRIFEIRGDRLTIGRSRDSDIYLEDLAVSRLHAIVYRDPSGQYLVRDENSANGTTVNGQRINDHVLEEGDEIGLGQTIIAFIRH